MSRNNSNLDCKVYVGELGYGAAKQELEEVFSQYGPLRSVWVARNPPGFAFIEFEDHHDVDDACRALDGTRINGRRVRVESSNGKSRWGREGPPSRRGGSGGGFGGKDGGRDGGRDRGRDGGGNFRKNSNPRGRSRSRSPKRRSPSPKRFRIRSAVHTNTKRAASKSPERKPASGRREWD